MPRPQQSFVYIGIKGHIIAFRRISGQEVWRTKLKSGMSGSYVSVYRDAEFVFATAAGEVWCLDPRTGNVLWHDRMKGMGTDLASISSDSPLGPPSIPIEPAMVAAARQRAAAAGGAA
jgi:outer membrane protein assembly factor BamB